MDLKLKQHSDIEKKLKEFQQINEMMEIIDHSKATIGEFTPKVENDLTYGIDLFVTTEASERNECHFELPGDVVNKMLEYLREQMAVKEDVLLNRAKQMMMKP